LTLLQPPSLVMQQKHARRPPELNRCQHFHIRRIQSLRIHQG